MPFSYRSSKNNTYFCRVSAGFLARFGPLKLGSPGLFVGLVAFGGFSRKGKDWGSSPSSFGDAREPFETLVAFAGFPAGSRLQREESRGLGAGAGLTDFGAHFAKDLLGLENFLPTIFRVFH